MEMEHYTSLVSCLVLVCMQSVVMTCLFTPIVVETLHVEVYIIIH